MNYLLILDGFFDIHFAFTAIEFNSTVPLQSISNCDAGKK